VPYLVDERCAPRARQGGVPDAYPQGHCRARTCALWDELTRCLDWESDGPTVRRGPARDWRYWSRRDAIQLALNAMGVSGCEPA